MISTISSLSSLSDVLAQKLIRDYQGDMWSLSKIWLILPTRRACQTMKDAFLRASLEKTMLLPKMTALYDIDVLDADLPEKISPLERQLLLMQLTARFLSVSPDKAYTIGGSLGDLLDEMYQYEVSFDALQNLVPDCFSAHWQQTLQFLEIIKTHWPKVLAQKGLIDIVDAQIKTLDTLVKNWQKKPLASPVFAIGFAGGLPSVCRFLGAVQKLPQGHIILPDLDTEMSDADWDVLDETHPQFHLKQLLDSLNVRRQDVALINPMTSERERLIRMAMKPAQNTHEWLTGKPFATSVLKDVRRIDCATPATEALTIAAELRRVLETPAKTAALVTTDRELARRVIAQMKRWNIILDDSAGTPLSHTPVGTYLSLLAEAGADKSDTTLLALLKHPMAQDGRTLGGLKIAVRKKEKIARTAKEKESFAPTLKTDLSPFFSLFVPHAIVPLDKLLKAHIAAAEQLATSADKTGNQRLWAGEDGQAAAAFLAELAEYSANLPDIKPEFYPLFFKTLLSGQTVRPTYGMNPRLDVLGPIEARLQQPDVAIIAEMNEGSFPPSPTADPWMSRPMRTVCGLPLFEEKIGVAAHDFTHLFNAPEVIITRALKKDGTPTIPSRWLSRLEALMGASHFAWQPEAEDIVALTQNIHASTLPTRPAPTPPLSARPKQLSITQIGTWMQDPYSIYAKAILKLKKLPELDEELSVSDYGTIVHRILEEYIRTTQNTDDVQKLLTLGHQALNKAGFPPASLAFFLPKFDRLAHWFVEQQTKRRQLSATSYLEKDAQITVGDDFTLTGKADRIDIFPDKTTEIIDYKTGTPPSGQEAIKGEAPQLFLEGMMLCKGGFKNLQDKDLTVRDLTYWRLTGASAGGEIKSVVDKKEAPCLIEQTEEGLKKLVQCFQDEKTPYVSCPKQKRPAYNDYEHLARLPEWISSEEDGE